MDPISRVLHLSDIYPAEYPMSNRCFILERMTYYGKYKAMIVKRYGINLGVLIQNYDDNGDRLAEITRSRNDDNYLAYISSNHEDSSEDTADYYQQLIEFKEVTFYRDGVIGIDFDTYIGEKEATNMEVVRETLQRIADILKANDDNQ